MAARFHGFIGDMQATLEENRINVADFTEQHWEGTVSNDDRSKRKLKGLPVIS